MNKNFYNLDQKDVARYFHTDLEAGLKNDQYQKYKEQYGENKLEEDKPPTLLQRFFAQLKNFMIYILFFACFISILTGEITDAVIIMAIIFLNAVMGIVQENKAEKSLEALKKLSSPHAKVIRENQIYTVSATELVPGDLVVLDAGDFIPADLRLIEAVNLKLDESSLTGESQPVEKQTDLLPEEKIPLAERNNMAYMSSLVTYGRGQGVVVETGMKTEIGKIAGMINKAETQMTPLQLKLEFLGKILGIIALGICSVIFLLGIYRGHDWLEMLLMAVSLAVAAIPEGLPAIVTIVLALSVQKMIQKNAIIKKLPAVETLGSVTIICSDKTGTLTQNKMTIVKAYQNGKIIEVATETSNIYLEKLIRFGLLCNDAKIKKDKSGQQRIGDPTELAFLDLALSKKINPEEIRKKASRLKEIPFDSARKMMTTFHEIEGKLVAITKGAPDVLLARCHQVEEKGQVLLFSEEKKKNILAGNHALAQGALRVLAVSYQILDKLPDEIVAEEVEKNMTFLGLFGMIDPPRPEVKTAVETCRQAGIKPIMITGDHKDTAVAIAQELGLITDKDMALTGSEIDALGLEEFESKIDQIAVYARVSPEHKVKIVQAWQKRGQIVAMTGDGVNDAPALKTANIGVAMGITGTEVSKGAADMILNDDNFATIVSAVKEGRHIYSNIKKSIHFLLSCNIGEIWAIFIAVLLGLPSPLLPIHILWVNLITDSLPAIALGVEPAEQGIMKRKPRRAKESIFSEGLGWKIAYQGAVIGGLTFAAFLLGLKKDLITANTMAFMTLSLSQLVHVFNTRSLRHSIFKIGLFKNNKLWGAFGISLLLQLAVVSNDFMRDVFKVVFLDFNSWLIVIGLSLIPLFIVELEKLLIKERG